VCQKLAKTWTFILTAIWTSVVCGPAMAITGPASPGNPFNDAYHVVRIIGSQNGYCTGVALSKIIVLTTAHCAVPGFQYIINAIDSVPLNIKVKASYLHPDFDVTSIRAHRATTDLSLLVLESPLPLFVYTPSIGTNPKSGERLTIIGYGKDDGGTPSLNSALLEVMQAGKLQIRLADPSTRDASSGLGACEGDSGGPAITRNDGRVSVVGIIVWSTGPNGQAGCGGLTGLVPLGPSRDWISNIVLRFDGAAVASRLDQSSASERLKPATANLKTATVKLKRDGGIFVVPVQVNGAITLDFAVDSGASDVTVPADVFSTLARTGTIKPEDIVGKQSYTLADGSSVQSVTFFIRSLKIGDHTIENVKASVAPKQGMLLLGQSFLERFSSWSVDNSTQSLRLEPR
jgi:clan AA aspartic protease (TIGR02281 family)